MGWDTAERVAAWVGGRARVPAPYRPDLLQEEFAELTARAEELVADSTGLRSAAGPGPGPGDRPGRVGECQRRQLPAAPRAPPRPAGPDPPVGVERRAGPAGRPAGLGRPDGHRCPDGCRPGLALDPGARPVRPAPDRGGHRRPGPRLLRGPERGGPRAPARLRSPGVPPVARPPRGHPPLPVHGHPLDARLLRVAGRGGPRLAAAGPGAAGRLAQADDRRDPGRDGTRWTTTGPWGWWPPRSSWRASTGSRR